VKDINDVWLFERIRDFLGVYLSGIRQRSQNTIKAHRDTVNMFLLFMETVKYADMYDITRDMITASCVMEFLAWLVNERGCTASTRNQRLFTLRTFFAYLAAKDKKLVPILGELNLIEPLPMKDTNDFVSLTTDQVKLVLAAPDIRKPTGLRDQLFMSLMYDSGARNQELLDMRLNDFHIKGDVGEIHLTGKGNKFRITPVTKEVTALFKHYKTVFQPENDGQQHLFYISRGGKKAQMSPDNVARFMNTYESKIKEDEPFFEHLHPHLFRRTRAMHLLEAGMPLFMIAEWLGHSNLETTRIYAKASVEIKRKAYEKVAITLNKEGFTEPAMYKYNREQMKQLYGLS